MQAISIRSPQKAPVNAEGSSFVFIAMHIDAGISRTGFRSLPDIINVKHIRTMTAYRKYRNEFLKIKIFFSLDALIFILFFLSGKILYNNNR